MNGQWMGEFKGSYGGLLIVNIDERLNNYEGLAYVLPLDKTIPMSALQFETENKTPTFKLRSYTPLAIHPLTGDFATLKPSPASSSVPTHARQLHIHPRSHLKIRLLPNTNLLPLLLPTIEPKYRSWPPLKYCATFE